MYINPKNQLDITADATTIKMMGLLSSIGQEYNLKAGDVVIREGQLVDFFFIVASGSFRAYRYAFDREITVGFTFTGDIDTAPYAFINNSHSTETIVALTNSTVIKIHRNALDTLTSQHHGMKNFIEQLLASYIEVLIQRLIEFKTITAEQAYHNLYERQPGEIQNIPLKYIASYLGISQERLSRIRKNKTI